MDQKWGLGLGLSATYAQIAAPSALLGVAPPADPFTSWIRGFLRMKAGSPLLELRPQFHPVGRGGRAAAVTSPC